MSKPSKPRRIFAEMIEAARSRTRKEFLDSREIENDRLSSAISARLICKIETENPVGCFKGRGATSFVNSLPETPGMLITASAGNFGLAMTYAAKHGGIPITVYAAETASRVKIDRIRSLGAEVKLAGQDFDEAKGIARKAASDSGAFFVEDGREPAITEGAGTMAMEITRSHPAIDAMLVPLGNGALIAGIACWFRSKSPKTRIIGVCAEGAPSMEMSWRSGEVQTTPRVDTIADGIAVRIPVLEALDDIQDVIDDIVLVNDEAIKRALKLVHEHLGMLVEPSAVVGVAAVMSHQALAKGVLCTPITGGNVTAAQFQAWIAEIQ